MGKICLSMLMIVALLLCIPVDSERFTPLSALCELSLPTGATYYVYCKDNSIGEITKNGDAVIVRCNKENFADAVKKAKSIYGVSVTFTGVSGNLSAIMEYFDMKTVSCDALCQSIYGYTEKISNFIYVDGRKVNLQIVYKNGTIHIGTPIILGSY